MTKRQRLRDLADKLSKFREKHPVCGQGSVFGGRLGAIEELLHEVSHLIELGYTKMPSDLVGRRVVDGVAHFGLTSREIRLDDIVTLRIQAMHTRLANVHELCAVAIELHVLRRLGIVLTKKQRQRLFRYVVGGLKFEHKGVNGLPHETYTNCDDCVIHLPADIAARVEKFEQSPIIHRKAEKAVRFLKENWS